MADGLTPKPPGWPRRGAFEELRSEIDVPPNSAANPLPTAFYGPKIPLPTGQDNRTEVTDLQAIFDVDRVHFAGWKMFFR